MSLLLIPPYAMLAGAQGALVGGVGDTFAYTNDEARAVVSAMPVKPDDTRKGVIDDYVGALKAAGVWTKMDVLYVLSAHDAQAALVNWKNPGSLPLYLINSPTFTADVGYNSDGSTSLLGIATPYSGIGQLVQDSVHLATVLSGTSVGVNAWGWSRQSGTGRYTQVYDTSNKFFSRLSANNGVVGGGSGASPAGYTVSARTAADAVEWWLDGAAKASATTASTDTGGTDEPRLLGGNGSYNAPTLITRLAHFGAALTNTEVGDLNTAWGDYVAAL